MLYTLASTSSLSFEYYLFFCLGYKDELTCRKSNCLVFFKKILISGSILRGNLVYPKLSSTTSQTARVKPISYITYLLFERYSPPVSQAFIWKCVPQCDLCNTCKRTFPILVLLKERLPFIVWFGIVQWREGTVVALYMWLYYRGHIDNP